MKEISNDRGKREVRVRMQYRGRQNRRPLELKKKVLQDRQQGIILEVAKGFQKLKSK